MSPPDIPQTGAEPGRVRRPARASDQAGWLRWMPGLQTLRSWPADLAIVDFQMQPLDGANIPI